MTGIRAIMPAHNEASRIEAPLEVMASLAQQNVIDGTLVISHNSTDGTTEIARGFDSSVEVIECFEPGKKDTALMAGIKVVAKTANTFFHCDADLNDLSIDEANRMVDVYQGMSATHMVVVPLSHEDNEDMYDAINGVVGGFSGQRIVPAKMVLDMPYSGMNGWGYEIKTTLEAIKHRALAVIDGEEVSIFHSPKSEKYGHLEGLLANLSMAKSIGTAAMLHMAAWLDPDTETVAQHLGIDQL